MRSGDIDLEASLRALYSVAGNLVNKRGVEKTILQASKYQCF